MVPSANVGQCSHCTAAARQGGGEWADRESTCHEVNNGNHKPMGYNSPIQQERPGLNEKQRPRNGIGALVGRKLVVRQPAAPWLQQQGWSQLGKGFDPAPPPGTHVKAPASAFCPLFQGQQSPEVVKDLEHITCQRFPLPMNHRVAQVGMDPRVLMICNNLMKNILKN